jgi:hypothetical protein
MASLSDKIKARRRLPARINAVGQSGILAQDKRAKRAGPENAGKQAIKRVGEYKRGRVDKASGDTIALNRRSQENLK